MNSVWVAQMAWRESRGSRQRLLIFLFSMVVGVALLVALSSTSESLQVSVNDQARELLGADMRFSNNQPFDGPTSAAIESVGIAKAQRISTLSVAYFPEVNQSRLVGIYAAQNNYPLYGSLKSNPPEAATGFQDQGGALVDQSLMRTLGVHPGDTIRVGTRGYAITGSLLRAPSDTEISMFMMPSVYIPLETLDTLLIGFGAMANYETYVKLDPREDAEAIRDSLYNSPNQSDTFNANVDTIEEQKSNWKEALRFFNQFLSLAGFGALILGGLGIGGAIRAHIRRCLDNIAVLQCLGTGHGRVFSIYFFQAFSLGCVAGILGCIGGVLAQWLIPNAIGTFLPFEIVFRLSWPSMVMGFGIGLFVTLIFAMIPLLDVRGVSPLRALRSGIEPLTPARVRFIAYVMIAGGLILIATIQSGSWRVSAYYALAISVAFGTLVLMAKFLMLLARRLNYRIPFYPFRQGIANLHRPGNQTILIMLALGLGSFIVMVLLISENTVVQQINKVGAEGRPDMILFDIQSEQLDGVIELIKEQDWPVIDSSPIVNMRLHSVGAKTVDELVRDSDRELTWPLTREYRSTYRDALTETESLADGAFTGVYTPDSAFVPISVENDFARMELGLNLGDTLTFNVQGRLILTQVTSFRTVDWEQMRSNFYVVFPANVLEDVPQTHVITSRREGDTSPDSLQSLIMADFPNITVLSLETIVEIVRNVLDRIRFAIQFMAYFCFAAGILVLIGSLLIGRLQRMEENGLLKALGASKRQLLMIALAEYFVLGLLSCATGIILSVVAGWILSITVFELPFSISGVSILMVTAVVVGLTVIIGFLSNRSVFDRPVLAILRAEG